MLLSPEQIEKNYKLFRSQCEKIGTRAPTVLAMLDHFDERLMMCPASSRKSFHRAVPGGLVDHSLRVLLNCFKLNKAFGWKLPEESIILAALFHDFGKIGGIDTPFYVESEHWEREKRGEFYQVNKKLEHMSVPHRTIFLMQHFGIKLTYDEMLAMLLNDGFIADENKDYCLKCPTLATCIMHADYIATVDEKNEETAIAEEAERIAQEAKEAKKAKDKSES